MAQRADRVWNVDTTEPKLTAFHETVDVETETNAYHQLVPSGFFLPLSNLKPRVKRNVLASGLRCVLAIR